ncbi:uncharacterized protein LOC123503140 [Portunus trituberculatus]|uniref:uncharacterized protein LOC123503140 n=1 Tax=Portunus trituberculatus TaxID=210409 RepID=UPI001E1CD5BC|nr:uncharacterized protein LOC123503140 [Portunus trituberculatus]
MKRRREKVIFFSLLLLLFPFSLQSNQDENQELCDQQTPMCSQEVSQLARSSASAVHLTPVNARVHSGVLEGCEGASVTMSCVNQTYFYFSYLSPLTTVTLTCAEGKWVLSSPAPHFVETHLWETRLNGCHERAQCYLEYLLESDMRVTSGWDVEGELVTKEGRVERLEWNEKVEEGETLILKGSEGDEVDMTCYEPNSLLWSHSEVVSRYTFHCNDYGKWKRRKNKCYEVCQTQKGEVCRFPFLYGGVEYDRCLEVDGQEFPMCGVAYYVQNSSELHLCNMNSDNSKCNQNSHEKLVCGGGPECIASLNLHGDARLTYSLATAPREEVEVYPSYISSDLQVGNSL